jgi:ribonuclease D
MKESFQKSITKQELDLLPIWSFPGKIILIREENMANNAVQALFERDCLGFDTETRPAFRKGQYYQPSLVQLATDEEVYLFQLQFCGIDPLIPLFMRDTPIKACLGVREDVRKLQGLEKFMDRGFIELADGARALGIKDGSLRKLSGILLGLRISKREQTSNWAKSDLSERQLRYAATDAWVSLKVHRRMQELIKIDAKPCE